MSFVLRVSLLVMFSAGSVSAAEDPSYFPWLMTSYRYAHLTPEQEKIYTYSFFETMGFILYSSSDNDDPDQARVINGWIDCVMATKDEGFWKNLWVFGKDVDKSAAYVLHRALSPLQCESYFAKAGTKRRVLQLYSYRDWDGWSLKDKAIYLSAYFDTTASVEIQKNEAGLPNDLREIGMIVDSTGEAGILSEIMEANRRGDYPLPWFVARSLGVSRGYVDESK